MKAALNGWLVVHWSAALVRVGDGTGVASEAAWDGDAAAEGATDAGATDAGAAADAGAADAGATDAGATDAGAGVEDELHAAKRAATTPSTADNRIVRLVPFTELLLDCQRSCPARCVTVWPIKPAPVV
jgi:hypothetical protein